MTLGIVVPEMPKKIGILHQPRFHVRALCAIFLTCAFHGSGREFGMAPYQEIFVSQRLVTLPSLMLLSKNEQFCPLTAGLNQMTDDIIHSTQYYMEYINRAILANLQCRTLKLGKLIRGFMLTSLFTFLLICIRLCAQKKTCQVYTDSRQLKSQ